MSRFTGAAEELDQSLRVNPYSDDELAGAMHQALCMEETERRARMGALRESVSRNDIYRWAGKIVGELGRIVVRRDLNAAA